MNTIDFLKANGHVSEDGFILIAQNLRDNWSWLKYSYAIAIKVRHRMKEDGITQKGLAQKLGCTQQHVSVILSGKANMTLETLAKLEQALAFDLIGRTLLEFRASVPEKETAGFLNDSSTEEPTPECIKTSGLVDGYTPKKKKSPKSH